MSILWMALGTVAYILFFIVVGKCVQRMGRDCHDPR